MPARTAPLASWDSFEKRQFTASSTYSGTNDTFDLLKHEAHNVKINTTFRLAVFNGAGWCSSTNSTPNNAGIGGESWQVNFDGSVLLSGLRLQYGLIPSVSDNGKLCRSWITRFRVDYHNGNGWLPLAYNLSSVDYDFTTLDDGGGDKMDSDSYVDFWFSPTSSMLTRVERFRLIPIEGKRECDGIKTSWSDQFCLRVGFFGYFLRRDLDSFIRGGRYASTPGSVSIIYFTLLFFTVSI